MKGLPLLTATTPISASVEDAAAIQVHDIVIKIASLNHDSPVFCFCFFLFHLCLVYPDKKTHLNMRGTEDPC